MLKLLAALLLSCGLQAGSVETWVGGSRPYETVPYFELNAGGFAALGGQRREGLRLDYGILDHWSAQAEWKREDAPSAEQAWMLGSQLRFGEEGRYFLDCAVFAEAGQRIRDDPSLGTGSQFQAGFLLGKQFELGNFALSAGYHGDDGAAFSLAYRSCFLFSAFQLGFEGLWSAGGRKELTPQLSFSLPGDIALQAGLQWRDSLEPAFLLSLSYEIFPTP
jgi:hypothetical protein